MKIINYGHACFKIISNIGAEEVSVVFDPYEDNSVPGLKISKDISANYVFASHSHSDHCAIDRVKLIPTTKKLKIKELILSHDTFKGTKRGKTIARIIYIKCENNEEMPEKYISICHMGDAADVKEILQIEDLRNIDYVLCPINGFFTMSAKDALLLLEKMNWKTIIPMHYEIKEKGIGYPDGGQIETFIKSIEDCYYVDDVLDVDKMDRVHKAVVFKTNR